MRRPKHITAKQRTEAARMRCWWRTVGRPLIQKVVANVVTEWMTNMEERMRESSERFERQIAGIGR
jgi:hypothetical protein